MVVVGGPEPRGPTALPGQREANVCCLKPLTRRSCLWPLERMTNFRARSLSVSACRSWPAAVGCCLKLLPLAAGQQSAAHRLRRCREAPCRVPCAHSGEDPSSGPFLGRDGPQSASECHWKVVTLQLACAGQDRLLGQEGCRFLKEVAAFV